MVPLARAAAERALALDPNQVEALATLANIAAVYDWDVAAGLPFSDRAFACESHVRTLAERTIILTGLESLPATLEQRALHDIRRARGLDPLSAWGHGDRELLPLLQKCESSHSRLCPLTRGPQRPISLCWVSPKVT